MSVTIGEIAQKANVSRSTVSRALKNSPLISAETCVRVQQVAAQLGYVPNFVAQSLSVKRTYTIGMVITHPSNPFSWHVIEGVELATHELGYSLFLSTARNDQNREYEVMQSFQRRRVDGIIVSSSHMKHFYNQMSLTIDIPVVVINEQFPGDTFHSVANDDYEGACLGTNYLVSSGHKRIGFFATPDRQQSNERRYCGYVDAMNASGLEPLPEFMPDEFAFTDFEVGFKTAEKVLRSDVTAVFCYNDRIALGLLASLHKRGIVVPDMLSVIGFDDIDEARYAVPALTTVRQPMAQLGYIAVEMLANILNDQPVENQVLDCELVVRDSTRSLEN